MQLLWLLEEIGLNPIQSIIYQTVLELTDCSIWTIAKTINKPRSTIYDNVKSLVSSYFLMENVHWSSTRYSATPVETLIELYKTKSKQTEEKAILLQKNQHLFEEKMLLPWYLPAVRILSGKEAVEILQSNMKYTRGFFVTDIDALCNYMNWTIDQVVDYFWADHLIEQKTIVSNTALGKQYKKKVDKLAIIGHEVKLLPDSFNGLESDNLIVDGVCYHISYNKIITAIQIKNTTYEKLQKAYFDLLWQSIV